MRVSDADRAEAADWLSKHYGDGRLDQAEFNQRLDQAMRATTRADLDALFADLPGGEQAPAQPKSPRPHGRSGRIGRGGRSLRRVVFLFLVIVITIVVGHALSRPYIPWLWIVLLALIWWRHGPWPDRRR
jgi:hypothetical protein